jgi:hypothetical protein
MVHCNEDNVRLATNRELSRGMSVYLHWSTDSRAIVCIRGTD